jgi:uncharacterized damage-inducible protein DinB
LFAHLVAAERVWLLRLSGEGAEAPPIWPDWSLKRVAAVVADNARDYQQFVATLSATDVEWYVEYKNSQGVLFSTRIIDILTHVALHGSYHRGQITMTLRAGGITPVNTDYITFVREA